VRIRNFLAEAAMIACNIPANINRKEFAFEKWKDWDNDLFDQIVNSL
jgi:putative N6-adenine-specific DNA methylase